MSEVIDKESKESIVKKLANALSCLRPQDVYIKFPEEINAIEIKIISSVFESLDHLERIKIVSDTIDEMLNTDLFGFQIAIVPLTEAEVTEV